MRILIISPIDPNTIEKLRTEYDVNCSYNPQPEELLKLIKDREVLIFRSGVKITENVLKNAPHLKLIIRAGCGLDNIDVNYAKNHGIELYTIPKPASFAVAELTFTHMLVLSRMILEADSSLRRGEWKKSELIGSLLMGKTLGIIGVGNIGTRVGQVGVNLGMTVIGNDIRDLAERKQQLLKLGIRLMDFDYVVSNSDYLTLHTPLDETTRYIINESVLAKMKEGAFLINMARGGVVDEKALYHELTQVKRLGGAALDVHENEGAGKISPVAKLPNVVLSPHMGSMTKDTMLQIGERVIEIIETFPENEKVKNREYHVA